MSLRSSTRVRSQSQHARIHLAAPVLIELLISAHHCIFNGLSTLGNQVMDLIELKAAANGWSEVLLVCNAMTNLAKTWSASDGTGRGLRAATTDAHYANSPGLQLAKHMITNASFRAKKISEDIPKVHLLRLSSYYNLPIYIYCGNYCAILCNALLVICPCK